MQISRISAESNRLQVNDKQQTNMRGGLRCLWFVFWQGGISREWVGGAQSLSPVIKIYWEWDSKKNGKTSQELEHLENKSFRRNAKNLVKSYRVAAP